MNKVRAKEIGSEFWRQELQTDREIVVDSKDKNANYFLSGRTALDFIVRDAIVEYGMERILLPSYCCHSMIQPFIDNKIQVRFYDIVWDGSTLRAFLPEALPQEAIFVLNYFGYIRDELYDCKQTAGKWIFAIEDKTQSCFGKEKEQFLRKKFQVAYSFSSYRKWGYLSGLAEAIKMEGDFSINKLALENYKYCELRNRAANAKRLFIESGAGSKNNFMKDFEAAEQLLDVDYKDYRAENEAIKSFKLWDIESIVKKRRENAEFLIKELVDIKGVQVIYKKLQEIDCPLFVPILVKENRDFLRKIMCENKIYCPTHWPLTKTHNISQSAKEVYEQELSIVCDQRYTIADMKYIVSILKSAIELL